MDLFQGESDILKGGEVGEEIVGLEDDADFLAMGAEAAFVGGNGFSVDEDLAGVGLIKAREQAEQGGFAATRWADEREGVLELDIEVEGVEHGLRAERFGDSSEGDFHLLRSF